MTLDTKNGELKFRIGENDIGVAFRNKEFKFRDFYAFVQLGSPDDKVSLIEYRE